MPQIPGWPDHARVRATPPLPPRYPVEPKVKAATGGAGAAAIVTAFLVWAADEVWWNGADAPGVPAPVVGIIGLVVGAALSFAGGWAAHHQRRLPPEK